MRSINRNQAIRHLLLFGGVCLLPLLGVAQASFTVLWSFDAENRSGSSTNMGVAVSDMATNDVTVPGIPTIAYTDGQSGQAVNVQNWSRSGCDNNEYVTFTISPVGSASLTVTQFSLYFSRTNAGPTLIKIRSSADNFASDLSSQATSTSFQSANVSISNVVNQTSPVSFRIYACSATATGGLLRLDEVTVNGTVIIAPLPVTLLSFTAKPEGDRVQLAWATTSERDADRFVIERSSDLREFTTVGEVAAKGTTTVRQYYGLTDEQPRPGANYYHLKQIDRDGTVHTYKPIAAIVRADEPTVAVYPNPVDAERIHLRLWNADDATVRLLTLSGQPVAGRLERRAGNADLVPERPLPAGMYLLEVRVNGQPRVRRVVVR